MIAEGGFPILSALLDGNKGGKCVQRSIFVKCNTRAVPCCIKQSEMIGC